MSIQELSLKFKDILHNTEYQLAGLIVVVALASFLLGQASGENNASVSEISTQNVASANVSAKSSNIESENGQKSTNSSVTPDESGKYVASKNGTKYHLPWCSGAKQMNEENKIWFETKEEAEKAGYLPAANCKGI